MGLYVLSPFSLDKIQLNVFFLKLTTSSKESHDKQSPVVRAERHVKVSCDKLLEL
jgi:hypothetical protein